jgi:hypothetical protein
VIAAIPFADNFLAGSIISLLFPVLLLIGIAIWYTVDIRRWPGSDSSQAPQGPITSSEPPVPEPPRGEA